MSISFIENTRCDLFWIIFKSILKVNHDNQLILVPWFIALITAIVPNIGKAFYSSYWLTFILFIPSVYDAGNIFTQEAAIKYLAEFTKGKTNYHVQDILSNYFLLSYSILRFRISF